MTGCIFVPLNADGTVTYPVGAAPYAPVVQPAPLRKHYRCGCGPTKPGRHRERHDRRHRHESLEWAWHFTLNVGDENMSGEATRSGGSNARMGVANAYGARGSYANCRYTMNSATQGTGSCTFSNGGQYQLHIGT